MVLPPLSLLAGTLEDAEQVVWCEQTDSRRWRLQGYVALLMGLSLPALLWHASTRSLRDWHWLVALFSVPGLLLSFLPWMQHNRARSTL